MKTTLGALAAALLLATSLPAAATPHAAPALAPHANDRAAMQVDRLLARWNRNDTPGCAVEVIHDGKVVYRRGVGMADLEHGSPITPATPFHVASVSKQFTAFAILLLAQDGKLALDDDIRKYLPEMPDFGKTITIRHLLNHTSGLRDQFSLLALGGWRFEDLITEDDIFGLARRQKTLNFEPGTDYAYSNTGYTLMSMIVRRVSGEPLSAFAQRRIFAPLGMAHTHFQDHYGTLVKGRALSYQPDASGKGYEYVALTYSNTGATSLFTTADDLVRWDRNFYDGRVGGKALLAQMQTPAVLNDGKPITYADGLFVDQYRGLKTVGHDGEDAGFRTELIRFPGQRFSVVVLANASDEIKAKRLALKIADVYLARQLAPEPAAQASGQAPAAITVDPAQLDAFAGEYVFKSYILTLSKEQGHLTAQLSGLMKVPLYATGERAFFGKADDSRYTFDSPGADGLARQVVMRLGGKDYPATRIAAPDRDPATLARFAGEYYSDELNVLYTVTIRDGRPVVTHPRGEVALHYVAPDTFIGDYPFGRVRFECRDGEACASFTVNDSRVRDLRFTRAAVRPVAGSDASGTARAPAVAPAG